MKHITTKILSMTSALLTAGALTASAQNADLEQLKSTVKSMEQTINELKQKSSEIVNVDLLPIANSGGPYLGLENVPLTLNGQLSQSNQSDIVKYQWDLDTDGFFDDGEGMLIEQYLLCKEHTR